MARKRKPKTAQEIAAELVARRAQDLAAVGVQSDAAALESFCDVEVTRAGQGRAGQTVQNDAARRLDAFEALRDSMKAKAYTGAYDAARRLEQDVLTALGQGDSGRALERVDCISRFDRVDVILSASDKVRDVQKLLAARDWWLLHELILNTGRRTTWRAIVAYITGEANPNAQGAAVRAACVNLRDAYDQLHLATKRAA